MKLIAKKSFRYNTRELNAGDAFDASDKDARVLKAIRKAEDAPDQGSSVDAPKPRARGAQAGRTGRMQFPEQPKAAAPTPAPVTAEPEVKPLSTDGFYSRRDLRAED